MTVHSLELPKPAKFLGWEWLSKFRTLGVLRVGYAGVAFVPFFALLINTSNDAIYQALVSLAPDSVPIGSVEFVLPMSLAWLFVGSLALAFGHLLNELACPPLIKMYGSVEAYRKSIAKHIKDQAVIDAAIAVQDRDFLKDLCERLDEDAAEIIRRATDEVVSSVKAPSEVAEAVETVRHFKAHWSKQDLSMRPLRVVIGTFYLAAAGILLYLLMRQLNSVYGAIT